MFSEISTDGLVFLGSCRNHQQDQRTSTFGIDFQESPKTNFDSNFRTIKEFLLLGNQAFIVHTGHCTHWIWLPNRSGHWPSNPYGIAASLKESSAAYEKWKMRLKVNKKGIEWEYCRNLEYLQCRRHNQRLEKHTSKPGAYGQAANSNGEYNCCPETDPNISTVDSVLWLVRFPNTWYYYFHWRYYTNISPTNKYFNTSDRRGETFTIKKALLRLCILFTQQPGCNRYGAKLQSIQWDGAPSGTEVEATQFVFLWNIWAMSNLF